MLCENGEYRSVQGTSSINIRQKLDKPQMGCHNVRHKLDNTWDGIPVLPEKMNTLMENVMMKVSRILTLVFAAAVFATPLSAQEAEMDIVDTAVAAGSFETLVAAVGAAGLVDVLKSEGPFTVFAPTDEAFAALPEGTVATLLKPENRDQLIAILTYHVVPGKVLSADVVNMTSAKTVQGSSVSIAVTDGNVTIDNAKVVAVDIETSNGVIHVIDQVILPSEG